jgi:hypothetical protein
MVVNNNVRISIADVTIVPDREGRFLSIGVLASTSVLFADDLAELAKLAQGLGLLVTAQRFDLDSGHWGPEYVLDGDQ